MKIKIQKDMASVFDEIMNISISVGCFVAIATLVENFAAIFFQIFSCITILLAEEIV